MDHLRRYYWIYLHWESSCWAD